VPIDLTVVRRFSLLCEVTRSAISSQDFLVAVALPGRISVWNFATGFLHREMAVDEPPIALIYDSFEGILTAAFRTSVTQYSVNGDKIHTLEFDREVTCACIFGYDSRFDARLLIVGHDDGSLSFCIVIESFELKRIFGKKVHNRRVTSLHCDTAAGLLWSCDDRGVAACVDFYLGERGGIPVVKCQFCVNAMALRCRKCQLPICEHCSTNGTCPSCRMQSEMPVFHPTLP
jgi:hypothetical protein